ncbi:MAG TPA: helix-turn-helix domain-containing protein [Streptosporangiaceae bacterium]|jgi:AcrR family transcriptional regulator|nr:helix-turn-helix domain-containing protein [Streptosporangiaceae bacterium]
MPRRTAPGRVTDIARAACDVFIEKGYRRALMTDVAARLGLNHALLYRYVESKEALLELAARYAVDPESDLSREVPLATPPAGHTVGLLRGWFAAHARFPVLRSALGSDPGEDPAAELAAVIDEFYSFVQDSRLLLSLMESLVVDYPELNALYVEDSKRRLTGRLAAFLGSRSASGSLRPVPDTEIAARFIVESVAWFAWRRQDDPGAVGIDDEQARRSVTELLLAAFVPDDRRAGVTG